MTEKTPINILTTEILEFEGCSISISGTAVLTGSILAALDAAGYVIVPKEPTEAMKEAVWYRFGDVYDACMNAAEETWRAMLAAKP